jgi:hypothetical protein
MEQRTAEAQARIRALYLAQAQLLASTGEPADRRLAAEVARFVRSRERRAHSRQCPAGVSNIAKPSAASSNAELAAGTT